jgi:hypothetical protein
LAKNQRNSQNFVISKVHVTGSGYVEETPDIENDIENNEGDEDLYFQVRE